MPLDDEAPSSYKTFKHSGICGFWCINMWHWLIPGFNRGLDKFPGVEHIPDTYMGFLLGVSEFDEAVTKFEAYSGMGSVDSLHAIVDECVRKGIDAKDVIKLKYQGTAGEATTPVLRKRLAEKMGLEDIVYDYLGVSEPQALCTDCYAHEGDHIWADYYYVEIIDPETGELLDPGERGEYVCTSLFARGIPWVRFATEDYVELIEEKCKCGRTHPRLKVLDRTVWVLRIKDKKISPLDARLIFEQYPETEDSIFNLIKYSEAMDKLKMKAYYNPAITKDPDGLKNKLIQDFKQKHDVDAEIEWVPFEKIDKRLHKIMWVVDLTKK